MSCKFRLSPSSEQSDFKSDLFFSTKVLYSYKVNKND
jgi:hypothetical protein